MVHGTLYMVHCTLNMARGTLYLYFTYIWVVSVFAYLFLGLVILVLPILSFQSKEILDESIDIPPKRDMYIQSIIMLSIMGVLAGLVSWKEGLDISLVGTFSFKILIAALLFYALSIIVNLIQIKYADEKSEEDFIMPVNRSEYGLWLLLCFTAAWSEEFTYRAVLPGLLDKAGLLPFLSIVMSALCFSFSHYTQGWWAIPITFLFALGFQYLFKFSGSLIVPVVVHFIYNLSIEWIKRKMEKKTG